MPCYLFTYHAYGSWLPDRPQGFVHWQRGLQPTDQGLATAYRRNMRLFPAEFDERLQLALIAELQTAADFQKFRLHAVATEPTHFHVLASWTDLRDAKRLGSGIKESSSRRLTKERGKRTWLSKGGSERRVADRGHFDHLLGKYLPSHGGWKWAERRGAYR